MMRKSTCLLLLASASLPVLGTAPRAQATAVGYFGYAKFTVGHNLEILVKPDPAGTTARVYVFDAIADACGAAGSGNTAVSAGLMGVLPATFTVAPDLTEATLAAVNIPLVCSDGTVDNAYTTPPVQWRESGPLMQDNGDPQGLYRPAIADDTSGNFLSTNLAYVAVGVEP